MTNLVKTLYVHFLLQYHCVLFSDRNTSHGPLFIGIIFSVFLYGITVTQSYLYYTTYKKDPKWLKILVRFLSLSEAQGLFNTPSFLGFGSTCFGYR